MKVFGIDEGEEVCANCRHFVQHYQRVRDGYGIDCFRAVNAGHCVEPRMKSRVPSDTCGRFVMEGR